MGSIWVREFTGGLDTRRMAETASGAVLIRAVNGHVNRGGEFEKRAAFVPTYTLPAGKTVGLAYDKAGVYVFSHLDAAGVGTLPAGVTYQRLQHPDGSTALVRVLSFDLYAGKIYAVAEFADGGRYHFYDGALVLDFKDGRARASFTITGGGVTPAVAATGSFTVTGGTSGVGNQITSISIDGVSLMFGAVAFQADAAATATALAAAINNHVSTPDYTASAVGAVVTIAQAAPDASVNGGAITVVVGGDVTVSAGTMSGGSAATTSTLSTLTVNSVDVLGGAVTWRTSNEVTAAAIVEAINTYASTPNYSATANGATVSILASDPGTAANGRAVAYTTANGLTISPGSGFLLAGGHNAVTLTAATGSFAVSGGSAGSGNTIWPKVNGVAITSAPVAHTGVGDTTADALAAAINSYTSTPDYTATAAGNVVTIKAVTKGSAANGLAVTATVAGTATVGSLVNMAGGLDAEYTYAPGTFVKTIGSRMHAVSGPNEHGSGIREPTKWTTDTTGAFFIDMSTQAAGAEELKSLATYQKYVAVFAERVVQIWQFDSDPNNSAQIQVLNNTGTASPRSVTQFGDNDLFYAAESGLRSLRARDASNAAATTDIGVPVDTLIVEKLQTLTAQERETAVFGLIEPRDGRFWLIIKDEVFVFSYFPGAKISAWSTYEPSYENDEGCMVAFDVEEAVVFRRRVYVRSGDAIYVYGGLGADLEYDKTEAEAWLPYLDGGQPSREKDFEGMDAAVEGVWQVSIALKPTATAVYDNTAKFFETTYGRQRMPIDGKSTHISPRFKSSGTGAAKLGAVVIHFTGDANED